MAVDYMSEVTAIDIALQSNFTCNIDGPSLSLKLFLIEMPQSH